MGYRYEGQEVGPRKWGKWDEDGPSPIAPIKSCRFEGSALFKCSHVMLGYGALENRSSADQAA